MIEIFKPINGRLLVDRDAPSEASFGGVLLPGSVAVDPFVAATVVAASEGYYNDFGTWIVSEFKIGDRIIVGRAGGIPIRLNGREVILLREQEVFGFVINKEEGTAGE